MRPASSRVPKNPFISESDIDWLNIMASDKGVKMLRTLQRVSSVRHHIEQLGIRGTLLYFRGRFGHEDSHAPNPFPVISKYGAHPLYCRPGTSDLDVFYEVYLGRVYGALDVLLDVGLVVDCGANVGFASAYFLNRFPSCTLIAIEPDSGNFSMLVRNLLPFKGRTTLLHAGVWSHDGGLVMAEEPHADGREWARQVRACRSGEVPSITAVSLATVLDESGFSRISLLKIDVEGAEAELFSSGYERWIDRVDTIAIELHDDTVFGPTSDLFFSVMAKHDFKVLRAGHVTVCTRLWSLDSDATVLA